MKNLRKWIINKKGITLIALVITIIVLLILAGVSIAMLTGQNGILTQAQRAKNETEQAQADEENTLANYESYLNSYSGENTEFTDSIGNKVIVPAGFRVVNPGDNVEDGIVIEDVTHGATAGSQFVWIPVGKGIKKKDGTTFDVTLGRYVFNEDGSINTELSKIEPTDELRQYTITDHSYYIEGLKDSITDNVHAKDIEEFISKANSSEGYYIARYEARTNIQRKTSTEDNNLTQLTVRTNEYVYNYVTQSQAANLSRNMYTDSHFTSDLVNRYAWVTAIDFFQKCDDREDKSKPYSRQNSINTESIALQGTNNLDVQDKICNVFDMASNLLEWTTETCSVAGSPCSFMGGIYNNSNVFSSTPYYSTNNYTEDDVSFRPILYL